MAPKDTISKKRNRVHPGTQQVFSDMEAAPGPSRRLSNEPDHGVQDSYVYAPMKKKEEDIKRKIHDADIVNDTDIEGVHREIAGNFYRYYAFRHFLDFVRSKRLRQVPRKSIVMRSSWLADRFRMCVRMLVSLVVFVIQLGGPFALSVHLLSAMTWRNFTINSTAESTAQLEYTQEYLDLSKNLLGGFFLFLFHANALFVVEHEWEQVEKLIVVADTFRKLTSIKGKYSMKYSVCRPLLLIDPLVNCMTISLCSLALPVLILNADDVKDVVFDALALLFIVKLDDVDGDLGYLKTLWEGALLGNIYGNIVDKTPMDQQGREGEEEEEEEEEQEDEEDYDYDRDGGDGVALSWTRFFAVSIYRVAYFYLAVGMFMMPIFYFLMVRSGVEAVSDIHREWLVEQIITNSENITQLSQSLHELGLIKNNMEA